MTTRREFLQGVAASPLLATLESNGKLNAVPAEPFVHLNVHSGYSLMDGACTIRQLVEAAKKRGMNALALTDHGNLHGAIKFYCVAKELGIKPIIGYEAYVAACHSPTAFPSRPFHHLTLLAKNRIGFHNLIKLASAATSSDGMPATVDHYQIKEFSEGVICLSGCRQGELAQLVLRGQHNQAMKIASLFAGIFGERYIIEIQNYGLPGQERIVAGLAEISRKFGIPLVATNNVHYIDREDAIARPVLKCIAKGTTLRETGWSESGAGELHLRTPQEMYAAFSGYEEAVRESQRIANEIEIELELGKPHGSRFTPSAGQSQVNCLRELCLNGLKERYADDPARSHEGEIATVVLERLDHELAMIDRCHLTNYLLVIGDCVKHAHQKGIPATARGSAVGSLVCYALGVSQVCPLKHSLLFERFLRGGQYISPSIALDVCKNRRHEIVEYLRDKYGADSVAEIVNFNAMAARATVRDVGRVLGLSIQRVDAIVDLIPNELHITLERALASSEELRKIHAGDPDVRRLLDVAMKIEGLPRTIGKQSAALAIADRAIVEYVPLQNLRSGNERVTQWDTWDVEMAGLLKINLLGNASFTVLARAIDLIEQSTNKRIDPYKLPHDEKTFALLGSGDTVGIYQLQGRRIREVLRKMKPDRFRDIVAINALYRPGPIEAGLIDEYIAIKNGRKPAVYSHPALKEILEETHGIILYQEQVMQVLHEVGGIDRTKTYLAHLAIAKQTQPAVARVENEFVAGAIRNGVCKQEAEAVFDTLETFAACTFNKSHSTAYAQVAYSMAWLKTHYPNEFEMAVQELYPDRRNDPVEA